MSTYRLWLEAAARRAFPTPDPSRRNVILCYHSVHPSAPYASASPDEFDRHLDWLQDHCTLVPLEQIRADECADRPRVAVTFDDGFGDNMRFVLPRLHERGVVATFFLTVGFLDRMPAVIERMAQLWQTSASEMTPLAWADVDDMRGAGMTFGSHTMSHPNLAAVEPAQARREMEESKRRLEDRLQEAIPTLAYPFGKLRHHVTKRTVELARSCGYERAVVTSPRAVAPSDDDLSLPRIVVGGDTLPQLERKVMGAIDWHAHVRERLPRALSERSLPGRR